MNVRLARFVAISIAVLFSLVSMGNLVAQDKKAPKTEKAQKSTAARQNVQGTVQDIIKDTSMITVRNGTKTQQVGYNATTKFLYGHSDNNKPGSAAQLKASYYISCIAALDSAKKQLMASECVYRETK
jgi:hypothetical protein